MDIEKDIEEALKVLEPIVGKLSTGLNSQLKELTQEERKEVEKQLSKHPQFIKVMKDLKNLDL